MGAVLARDAENRRLEGESASKLRREEADAASERELKAEAARKERDEYDRAVKRAEDFRETERSKQKTFKDTEVGKVWEKTGGTAPFLLGAISGFTQRGMNPNVSLGKVGGFGAVGGAAASNVPIGADAYLVPPVENPDKRAAEAYARELPPNHPRKKEWMDYAASPRLPDLNPARAEAKKELYDTEHYGLGALERNLFGAAEGAVGAELGYGAWHIPARGFNALGRLLRGPRGPQSADATPGVGGGGTPSPAGPPSLSPTAGDPGGVGRLQGTIVESGPSALGQGRLPAPEAVPNQQTLSQVLKQLDVANSNRAHHSRYQPRGQKDNPAQFKKGKPEFPPDEK